MKTISLSMLLTILNCLAEIPSQEIEDAKIQYLLNTVEKSSITFIRNGESHDGKKAREHLESKMSYARKRFWFFGPKLDITVENFIEKIASRSSMSSKQYNVKLQDGTIMPTNQWLRIQLNNFVYRK